MLTQEQCDEEEEGAEEKAGEAAEGEEEEDDDNEDDDDDDKDSKEGYVSPEDPFPRETRRKPTEEDLDKDFDPKRR
jgi:hypothetical protein